MLLPPPLGPTSATVSPGRELEVDRVEHGPVRGRVRERDALEPHGRVARARRRDAAGADGRRARSTRSSSRSATARPSALAWYCAARFRSGR